MMFRVCWVFQSTLPCGQGHVTSCGYTEHMLQQLKTSKGFLLHGRGKTVGGPEAVTQSMISRARETMRWYTKLAAEVVNAEFPSFELLQAFCIFDVQPRKESSLDEALQNTSVERLAKVFSVDMQMLMNQYLDHRPIALNEARSHRMSNSEAWASAVQRTSRRASTAQNHPSAALREVLMRYLCSLA